MPNESSQTINGHAKIHKEKHPLTWSSRILFGLLAFLLGVHPRVGVVPKVHQEIKFSGTCTGRFAWMAKIRVDGPQLQEDSRGWPTAPGRFAWMARNSREIRVRNSRDSRGWPATPGRFAWMARNSRKIRVDDLQLPEDSRGWPVTPRRFAWMACNFRKIRGNCK